MVVDAVRGRRVFTPRALTALQDDEADTLVDCIRALRDTKARLYTKEEVPFITGIRKPIAGCIDDCC